MMGKAQYHFARENVLFISSTHLLGIQNALIIVQKHQHMEEIWRARAVYGVRLV